MKKKKKKNKKKKGNTPLMIARMDNNEGVIKCLTEHGAK